MFKINLHAHSRYSDGSNTIRDMALESKHLGFSACVITDHVYPSRKGITHTVSLDEAKFIKALIEANAVSKELDYPVILGAEFVVNYEEILVFGTGAILSLLILRDTNGTISVEDIREARASYGCATIMAHPHKPYQWKAVDILDGFELFNNVVFQFSRNGIPPNFKHLTPFANSDAHSDYDLSLSWNVTERAITNEKDLIAFIRGSCPIAHHVSPIRTLADVFSELEEY